MAYRFPRAGHLEICTPQPSFAPFAWSAFGLLLAVHLGLAIYEHGGSADLLGPALGVIGCTGMARISRRTDRWEATREGAHLPGESSLAPRPVDRVRLRIELLGAAPNVGAKAGPVVRYVVEAMVGDRQDERALTIERSVSETRARQVAEAVAIQMGWALEDTLGDFEELRLPDEMSRRAERKPAPTEPPPRGVRVDVRHGEEVVLVEDEFPEAFRRRIPIVATGTAAASLATAAALWTLLGVTSVTLGIGSGLVVVAGAAIALRLAPCRLASEISVQQGVLHRRLALGPCVVQTKEVDLRRVERVRVQTLEPLTRGCAVVSDDTTLRAGRSLEKPALLWLQAWIQSRIP